MPDILLIDDHPLVQVALEAALQKSSRLWQLVSVTNDTQAMTSLISSIPDVVILDIGLPGTDGLQLLKRLLRQFPNLPVVIYTAQEEDVYARLAQSGGACGFIGKGRPMDELIAAVNDVYEGGHCFPDWSGAQSKADQPAEPVGLTPKEIHILGLLTQGFSNLQIADMLHISNKTVSTHKKNILRKTGASNLFELAAVYKEQNS